MIDLELPRADRLDKIRLENIPIYLIFSFHVVSTRPAVLHTAVQAHFQTCPLFRPGALSKPFRGKQGAAVWGKPPVTLLWYVRAQDAHRV